MGINKIIHVDMDCFYAAVEVRDNPSLRGRPVAVGGHPDGRGVLTTANYEARKYGVRSAMPVKSALNRCPGLILVPVHFSKYRYESRKIHKIFNDYSERIQPLSLDEAYIDVTECSKHQGSASLIAREIRHRIYTETGLTASAGIAPNKFLAKVASDWKKPNGQFTISPDMIEGFVKDLPIAKIPGVGPVTQKKMYAMGIKTCADLQVYSVSEMNRHFGQWGLGLYDLSRGIDARQVRPHGPSKSLSVERTFSDDLRNLKELEDRIPSIFEEFKNRLQNKEGKIEHLYVKLKFFDFQTTTVSRVHLKTPSVENFLLLIEEAYLRHSKPVRLVGLGVRLAAPKNKISSRQLNLFGG
ncbi:MAG: DNA polymerase IV [Bdellovibrionales bacterium]